MRDETETQIPAVSRVVMEAGVVVGVVVLGVVVVSVVDGGGGCSGWIVEKKWR